MLSYVWITMTKNTPPTLGFWYCSNTFTGLLTRNMSRRSDSVEQILAYVFCCSQRDDRDSGSVQDGCPLCHRGLEKTRPLRVWNHVSMQFITTGHSGRCQTSELRLTEAHLCRDVFTGVAEELIPLFLAQTGRFPIVLPNVIVDLLLPQHLRIHFSPHVFLIFHSCSRNPVSWIIHFGPTNRTGWIVQPRTLCWWLIRTFKCSFSCLIARLSLRSGIVRKLLLLIRWFTGWTDSSARTFCTFSSISRDKTSGGMDQLISEILRHGLTTAITVRMTGNIRRNLHVLTLKRFSKTWVALGIKLRKRRRR